MILTKCFDILKIAGQCCWRYRLAEGDPDIGNQFSDDVIQTVIAMKENLPITDKLAGMYIHIPFCVRKCPYCDFYSVKDGSFPRNRFIDAVLAEIGLVRDFPFPFDTLYLGGGTPSVLAAMEIKSIIDAARNVFRFSALPEITIEVNPGTVSRGKLRAFKDAGINRINIGVQSFADKTLRFLGRIHSSSESRTALASARSAGFDNIGMDLIFGVPEQSRESWASDLRSAVDVGPDHLSCYGLTFETGTPMETNLSKRRFKPVPEADVADMFETTMTFLTENGYHQYEISNYSKSHATRSAHNRKYWSSLPYLGIGPSAHSFANSKRWWNVASVADYCNAIERRVSPIRGKEDLGPEQLVTEAIFLGLRKTDGIRIREFEDRFKLSFKDTYGPVVARLKEDGLVVADIDCCRLTRKGILFADGIASLMIESGNRFAMGCND